MISFLLVKLGEIQERRVNYHINSFGWNNLYEVGDKTGSPTLVTVLVYMFELLIQVQLKTKDNLVLLHQFLIMNIILGFDVID